MKIQVHIERLVLEGLPVHTQDGWRIRSAVAAELERLIGARGIGAELRGGGAVETVPAGAVRIDRQASPRRMGTDIARAVYGGLRRPE